ncbi:hypothetical protein [Gordonia sp. (in: high G+C Gram-positive bacteria)]|uniref:hypothetical protein n=1 Tax=Gordonia sp. (in: high G+C Gram-positive bacteria) TaxID=84139 RepID=UPI0039E24497
MAELDEGVVRVVRGEERSLNWIVGVVAPFIAVMGGFMLGSSVFGESDADLLGFGSVGIAMILLALVTVPLLRPGWLPVFLRRSWYRRGEQTVEFGVRRWANIPFAVAMLLFGAAPLMWLALEPDSTMITGRGTFMLWLSPVLILLGLAFLIPGVSRTRVGKRSVSIAGRSFGRRRTVVVTDIQAVTLDAPNHNIRLRVVGDVARAGKKKSDKAWVPVPWCGDVSMLEQLRDIQEVLGVPITL